MNIFARLSLPLLFAALLAGCSHSTFLIDKDGASAYFGRNQSHLNASLCDGGDLRVIMKEAELPRSIEEDMFRYVCTDERNYDKVASLYLFLTPEQKKKFQKAFVNHGYKVNAASCCG